MISRIKNFCLFVLIFFISGMSVAQTKPYLAEDLVGIVGEQSVMMSEWMASIQSVNEFRKQYGTMPGAAPVEIEALENLFAQKLMIQCAKRDSLDKDVNSLTVEAQVEEMVSNMADEVGGVKALEAIYSKPVFQIKEDVKSSVIENELASSMQSSLRNKCRVSIPEVREFYETIGKDTLPMIPAQYCYAQIVRVPEATEEKQFEIREKLLEYRERVLKGERLSVLARMYSQAHDGSPQKGGEVGPVDINSLVPPFIAALEQLEPGQVSEVVETEYGYHIIELISKKGNMVHFRHLLLTPEFTVEQVQEVTNMLDSVANLIKTGEITFDQAALKYSNENTSKFNGGVVFNTNSYHATAKLDQTSTYFLADELFPTDQRHLNYMNVGEISECYQALNTNGLIVYKIVKLVDYRKPHVISLDYEYPYIKDAAFEKKFNDYLTEWIVSELKKMYVYIKPDYRSLPFSVHEWIDRSSECENNAHFDNVEYSSNTSESAGDATSQVSDDVQPAADTVKQ